MSTMGEYIGRQDKRTYQESQMGYQEWWLHLHDNRLNERGEFIMAKWVRKICLKHQKPTESLKKS